MKGITRVPHMGRGDLCFITVVQSGSVDAIGRIGPENFSGRYKGRVVAVEAGTGKISAVFTDARITQDDDLEIRRLDDREPPFAYTVEPRYRMQGLSSENDFELGQRCVVQIGHFDKNHELLDNPGMSRDEVSEIFPTEMIGLWEGQIIYAVSQGYEAGDGRLYPVAVILTDERIRTHDNENVRRWFNLEPPVRYSIYHDRGMAEVGMHALKWWQTIRDAVMVSWPVADAVGHIAD